MKKLLISSVVVVLCMGAPAVHADDTHHPEQGSAPASKSVPVKGEATWERRDPKDNSGDSAAAGTQMDMAQERMKQARALMGKLQITKDPAERHRLMQEHTQALRDTMGMMSDMKMDMMGSGQGMGMMSQDKGQAKSGGMMDMHQMMEKRMEMMQMMMEQIFERQEMLMKDGK
jgi:hypothetical protein